MKKMYLILAMAIISLQTNAQNTGTALNWRNTSETVFSDSSLVKEIDFGEGQVFRVYTFKNNDGRPYSVLFQFTGYTETCVKIPIYTEIKLDVGGIDPYAVWTEEKYVRQKGGTVDLIYHVQGTERMGIVYDIKTKEWRP